MACCVFDVWWSETLDGMRPFPTRCFVCYFMRVPAWVTASSHKLLHFTLKAKQEGHLRPIIWENHSTRSRQQLLHLCNGKCPAVENFSKPDLRRTPKRQRTRTEGKSTGMRIRLSSSFPSVSIHGACESQSEFEGLVFF